MSATTRRPPARPRRFSVNLTVAQAELVEQLAHEFRATPGDMLAALAIGSINEIAHGDVEALVVTHAALYQVIVRGECPSIALPINSCDVIGEDGGEAA